LRRVDASAGAACVRRRSTALIDAAAVGEIRRDVHDGYQIAGVVILIGGRVSGQDAGRRTHQDSSPEANADEAQLALIRWHLVPYRPAVWRTLTPPAVRVDYPAAPFPVNGYISIKNKYA